MNSSSPVSIVGFAGCTSLGYSLGATLAAMGAGLSNFTDTGIKNLFGTPAVAASLFAPATSRIERLTALTRVGLADLQVLLSQIGLAYAPLMVGLPSDLSADEQVLLREELRRNSVVRPGAVWFPNGRASTFGALADAMDLVGRGAHRVIVVGGIDSLCAPDIVNRLVQAERVLGPHTEGTIPGEAAVFSVVARMDDPAVDPTTSVIVEAVVQHQAAVPFMQLDRVSGDALAAVFRSFRERGSHRVERVIAAHSGEGYFGRSFAHAYLREVDVMPEPLEVEQVADCVGDVGAAAGTLGLAFAMHQMVTDARSTRGRALVYSESDTGELGAAIIDGAPTSWLRRTVT